MSTSGLERAQGTSRPLRLVEPTVDDRRRSAGLLEQLDGRLGSASLEQIVDWFAPPGAYPDAWCVVCQADERARLRHGPAASIVRAGIVAFAMRCALCRATVTKAGVLRALMEDAGFVGTALLERWTWDRRSTS